jgi:MSHA pilin protein MshD
MCINKSQHGISLIELILFIIIVSIALTSLLMVMNMNTQSSVDPLLRKQALAIAESVLEEVELQDFSNPAGGFAGAGNVANRSSFDDIFDYNGINTTANVITGITGLSSYAVTVAVVNPAIAWGTIPANDVAEITVTVTDSSGQSLQAVGYRVNY